MEKTRFNSRGLRLLSGVGLCLSLAFGPACTKGNKKAADKSKTGELTASANTAAADDADMKEVILNVFGMT